MNLNSFYEFNLICNFLFTQILSKLLRDCSVSFLLNLFLNTFWLLRSQTLDILSVEYPLFVMFWKEQTLFYQYLTNLVLNFIELFVKRKTKGWTFPLYFHSFFFKTWYLGNKKVKFLKHQDDYFVGAILSKKVHWVENPKRNTRFTNHCNVLIK